MKAEGDTRIPAGWKPLSWSLNAKIARTVARNPNGDPLQLAITLADDERDALERIFR